jgi:hypothetical protein
MKRLLLTCWLGLAIAVACGDDDGDRDGGPSATAGVPSSAGSPQVGGGDSSSAGEPAASGGAQPLAGSGGAPASAAAGGAAGSSEPQPTAGSAGSADDPLGGCMTPTPGLVDYCADEPKQNAIYCVSPAEAPFADCDPSPDHPPNFDGWCCETAACVRATAWDAICGVLAPGKTRGYTCHADAAAPSAECLRTADGACCP